MLINAKTKDKREINISLEHIKKTESKDNNYIRIYYEDGSNLNLAYNNTSFDFRIDYVLDMQEINNIIQQINERAV